MPKRKSRLKIIKETVQEHASIRNLLIVILVVTSFRLWFSRTKAKEAVAAISGPPDKKRVIIHEIEKPPYLIREHPGNKISFSIGDKNVQEKLCEDYVQFAQEENITMQAVLRTQNAFEFFKMLFMTREEIETYRENDKVFTLNDRETAILLQNSKQFAKNSENDIETKLRSTQMMQGLQLPRSMEFRYEYWEQRRIYPEILPPLEISSENLTFARKIDFLGYKISEYSIKILLMYMEKHNLHHHDGDVMGWDDATKTETFHALLRHFIGDNFDSGDFLQILKRDVSCFKFSSSLPVAGIIVLKEALKYKDLMARDHFQSFAYKLNDLRLEVKRESDFTMSETGNYDLFRVRTDTLYLSDNEMKSAAAENELIMDGMMKNVVNNIVKHVNSVDKLTTTIYSALVYMAIFLQFVNAVIPTKSTPNHEPENLGPEQKKNVMKNYGMLVFVSATQMTYEIFYKKFWRLMAAMLYIGIGLSLFETMRVAAPVVTEVTGVASGVLHSPLNVFFPPDKSEMQMLNVSNILDLPIDTEPGLPVPIDPTPKDTEPDKVIQKKDFYFEVTQIPARVYQKFFLLGSIAFYDVLDKFTDNNIELFRQAMGNDVYSTYISQGLQRIQNEHHATILSTFSEMYKVILSESIYSHAFNKLLPHSTQILIELAEISEEGSSDGAVDYAIQYLMSAVPTGANLITKSVELEKPMEQTVAGIIATHGDAIAGQLHIHKVNEIASVGGQSMAAIAASKMTGNQFLEHIVKDSITPVFKNWAVKGSSATQKQLARLLLAGVATYYGNVVIPASLTRVWLAPTDKFNEILNTLNDHTAKMKQYTDIKNLSNKKLLNFVARFMSVYHALDPSKEKKLFGEQSYMLKTQCIGAQIMEKVNTFAPVFDVEPKLKEIHENKCKQLVQAETGSFFERLLGMSLKHFADYHDSVGEILGHLIQSMSYIDETSPFYTKLAAKMFAENGKARTEQEIWDLENNLKQAAVDENQNPNLPNATTGKKKKKKKQTEDNVSDKNQRFFEKFLAEEKKNRPDGSKGEKSLDEFFEARDGVNVRDSLTFVMKCSDIVVSRTTIKKCEKSVFEFEKNLRKTPLAARI